jgi:hypothetical protein
MSDSPFLTSLSLFSISVNVSLKSHRVVLITQTCLLDFLDSEQFASVLEQVAQKIRPLIGQYHFGCPEFEYNTAHKFPRYRFRVPSRDLFCNNELCQVVLER